MISASDGEEARFSKIGFRKVAAGPRRAIRRDTRRDPTLFSVPVSPQRPTFTPGAEG